MRPTAGTVRVNGLDLDSHRAEIRSLLGYLPQQFNTFPKLKTWELLEYAAALAGVHGRRARMREVDAMLEQVGLFDARDRMVKKLSGGMKRRLGIAQALIGDPKIVVVDEPTTGLDPEERIRFRGLLTELSHRDIIIVLSTHIVGDISSSCAEMALLNEGRVVYNASPDELIEKVRGHAWRIVADDRQLESIKERYPVISTIPAERGWEVDVVAESLDDFAGTPVEPNLEHAYVYFMECATVQ
jgi:ABC-type multidrug transport system ATPase subunit